ncbi:MAG: hypothetical protein KF812_12900, partial [Fimbriimonadaceae bacterium]|nr:hypothetical protein [Fimbriimonadaceae bacterium]
LDEYLDGRGNVEIGRDRQDTRRVRVILNRNGRFTIRNEDGWRVEFNGSWREDRDGVISLFVDSIPGRSNASGNGTLRLEGGSDRISSVELSGRANGEYFSLSVRR